MAALVDDGADRCAVPVGAPQKVDEVDAERVLRLPDLPLLPAAFALEVLAESADLVSHRLVGGRARQEATDPADAVGRRLLLDEPRLQEELAKLLQRGLEIAHGHITSAASSATAVPVRRLRNVSRSRWHESLCQRPWAAGCCRPKRSCQRWMSSKTSNWRRPHIPGLACLGRRNQSVGSGAITPGNSAS
jgi:hypothetical protein